MSRKRVAVFAAASLAAVTLGTGVAQAESPGNAYGLAKSITPAIDCPDGTATKTVGKRANGDGTITYELLTPKGGTQEQTLPDASWDPGTDTSLDDSLGLPERPKGLARAGVRATFENDRAAWVKQMATIKNQPIGFCVVPGPAPAPLTASNYAGAITSGVADYNRVDSSYTLPFLTPNACSGDSLTIWTGLGGIKTPIGGNPGDARLLQTGVNMLDPFGRDGVWIVGLTYSGGQLAHYTDELIFPGSAQYVQQGAYYRSKTTYQAGAVQFTAIFTGQTFVSGTLGSLNDVITGNNYPTSAWYDGQTTESIAERYLGQGAVALTKFSGFSAPTYYAARSGQSGLPYNSFAHNFYQMLGNGNAPLTSVPVDIAGNTQGGFSLNWLACQ